MIILKHISSMLCETDSNLQILMHTVSIHIDTTRIKEKSPTHTRPHIHIFPLSNSRNYYVGSYSC